MEFIKRHPLLSGFGILTIIIVLAVVIARANQSAAELTTRALRNYQRGFLDQASYDINRALSIAPDDEKTIIVGATISIELNDLDKARELYGRIKTPRLLDQHMLLADAAIGMRHLEFAEQILDAAAAQQDDYLRARYIKLELYRLTYRQWEHRRLLLQFTADRDALRPDIDFLFSLQNPHNAGENEFREQTRELNQPDQLVKLTACVNHVRYRDYGPALEGLQQVVLARPDLIEAQARLGLLLVELNDTVALRDWFVNLPPEAFAHPNVCYSAGMLFESQSAPAEALAFHQQALLGDYRHRESLKRLIALLGEADSELLAQLQEVAALEDELHELIATNIPSPNSADVDPRWGESVLEVLKGLGWLLEARVWCDLFHGDTAATLQREQAEINERLDEAANAAEGTENDWPALMPIMRALDLAEPHTTEWFLEQQAALRDE